MTSLAVTVQFECRSLPPRAFDGLADLRLGIQKGKEVEDDVASDVPDVVFRFTLQARHDAASGRPVFTGAYAQGTPADRFVYLCWGERRDGAWQTSMRVKVPLGHLTWAQVERAANEQRPISAILRMTDDRGRPIAATIKEANIDWLLP